MTSSANDMRVADALSTIVHGSEKSRHVSKLIELMETYLHYSDEINQIMAIFDESIKKPKLRDKLKKFDSEIEAIKKKSV